MRTKAEQEWTEGAERAVALSARRNDPAFIRAVKAGCSAADMHLRCSFPDCNCKQFPRAIMAAVDAY